MHSYEALRRCALENTQQRFNNADLGLLRAQGMLVFIYTQSSAHGLKAHTSVQDKQSRVSLGCAPIIGRMVRATTTHKSI